MWRKFRIWTAPKLGWIFSDKIFGISRSYKVLYRKFEVNFFSEKGKEKKNTFTAAQLIVVNQNYFLPAYIIKGD